MEKLKAHHLTESLHKDAAIIFGRFNPPHFGHKAAWEIAAKHDIWYVGTNQGTQGPKDPLPFDIKVEAMKTFMPELEGHLVAEQSWFTLASMVYKKYGSVTLHIVTDSVDVNTYLPMLQGQNGKEGPHGFYHFKAILWAEAKRQSEASLVRKAIKENNPQDFAKYSGVPADTIIAKHPYFQLVRHYMMPYMEAEIAKEKQKAEKEQQRAEKEKQKAEKLAMKQTKIKGPAQELAESNLRELSTDKLAQYKKTAYADAKKADAGGDYARGDKRFKGINKATNKQFANDLKKHGQQGVAEAEGDATGVPHVTKELLQHIVKQVGAEGAHAIVKSLEWGDGAAKELLHLIVRDLEKDISMAEAVKQRLDPKCWKGKHKEGTKMKGGVRVNNCVPNEGRVRLGQLFEEIWQQRFNK